MKFCSNCGQQVQNNAEFCPKCGNKVRHQATTQRVQQEVLQSVAQPMPQQPTYGVSTDFSASLDYYVTPENMTIQDPFLCFKGRMKRM